MGANAASRVGPRRVVVTGSRAWASPRVIREALRKVWGDGRTVLVTGGSPSGADRVAAMMWRRWGGQVERRGGGWRLHDGVADACLSFVRDGSGSAIAQLTEHGGIPVVTHNSAQHQPRGRRDRRPGQAVSAARDAVNRLYEQRTTTRDSADTDQRCNGASGRAAGDHAEGSARGEDDSADGLGGEGRGASW